MKKLLSSPVVFLIFISLFISKIATAHPGDSCSNPIAITPIATPTITDYQFGSGDSVMWFSFTAPYSRLTIETDFPINAVDTPRAYIDSLIIYKGSTCGSLSRVAYIVSRNGSDTFPSIQMLSFIPSSRYYVKVTRYMRGTNCSSCQPYFGLDPILLSNPIIPPLANCPPCGPNLLCNGNFEDTVVPHSYQNANGGACYQDDSYTWHSTPPPPGGQSYCLSSPNMRYGTGCTLQPGFLGTDITDIYIITNNTPIGYYNTPYSGSEFMLVDAPSNWCLSCSVVAGGTVPTTNYIDTSWQEEIGAIPGATYLFSFALREADTPANGGFLGATVSAYIHNSIYFSDVIDYNNYTNWNSVKFCWYDTSASTADIVITGQGAPNYDGYDYEMDSATYYLSSLPIITYTSSDTICSGDSVTLLSSYGYLNSPYLTYNWSPNTGLSCYTCPEPKASPSVTTTYTCVIGTTQGSCADTVMVKVVVKSSPIITVTDTNIKCYGEIGNASAHVSGGVPPYTYLWSNGQTTSNITGLSGGSYSIVVTGNNGCTATAGVTITQPTLLSVIASVRSNVQCNGENNGSATSSASGGIPGYAYLWNNGQTLSAATGLIAGSYTITVTDANGCTATASVTITQPTALTATMGSPINPLCNGGSGSATVTAGGGISPYTYSWSPSGGTNATGTGLIAGSYTVTVKDHNGCTATASVTITQPAPITIAFNPTNPEVCPGSTSSTSVTANPSGGTPAYTYLWSNGQTTAFASGLHAGTYNVTVTDAHGCTASASVTINTDNLSVTVAPNNICTSGTGTLTANASSGVAPYTYSWSPGGQTTATATGLTAGTYTVLVTDANGCTATAKGTLTLDGLGVSISPGSGTPPTPCVGSRVTLTALVNAGVSPYTYAWSNGITTSTDNINIHAGTNTYSIAVTDSNGCTTTASISLIADNISVSLSGDTLICQATSGGGSTVITAHASGGTSPYTYSWSPGGATTSSVTITTAGTYTVTLTDANGCTATASITTYSDLLSVTVPNVAVCMSTGVASLTAYPTGGYSPYTYSWSTSPAQTNVTATGLFVGSYTVTVTDAKGCTAIGTGSVSIDVIAVSLSAATSDANISCGTTPKEYCATVSGGVSPYVYTWAISGGTSTSVPPNCLDVVWNLPYADNTVTVTVTDSNGCEASSIYTVDACCGYPDTVYLALDNFTVTPTSFTAQTGPPVISYTSGEWLLDDFKTNASLAIYGTLDVSTADLQINCSNVLMGTGSQIVVESGRTLDIEISHLHSCDQMWNHIDLKPGAILIVNGSLIEDAQQAVYAENGPLAADISMYTLNGSIFNRDSIDVELMPYPFIYTGTITKCTFSSDSSSGVPCAGSFPYSINTAIPLAQIAPNYPNRGALGVVVRGVKGIAVGNATNSTYLNTFVDIDCGIYSESGSIKVVNDKFTNMTPVTGSIHNNLSIPLAGVFAKGSGTAPCLLIVGGVASGTYDPCYFTQCQYGIWAMNNINSTIESNYIEGYSPSYTLTIPSPNYGVYVEGNYLKEEHIAFNYTIHDCEYGVGAYNNPYANVYIDSNSSFTSNNHWGNCYGVNINEPTSTTANYWVLDNIMNTVENGVLCNGLNAAKVIYNNITLSGSGGTQNGVEMDYCNHSTVKENTVNYSGAVPTTVGIVLNGGAPSQTINCNTLNAPYTGLAINSSQYPISIERNNFDMPLGCPTAYGIDLLNPAGYIGINTTPPTETNTWNLFYPCGSLWATYSNPSLPNTFIIPSSISYPSSNDPTITMNGGYPIVFSRTGGTDTYSCSAHYFSVVAPLNKQNALVVVNDSVAYPFYPQTSYWQSKYNLYDYMYTVDSSLVDSSTAIQHFYDSTANANIGKIVHINALLGDSNGVSGSDIMTAAYLNNHISSPDTAESIYQKVYGILIPLYASGGQLIPTATSQINTLDSIALFCPGQYGSGVYVARALLSQIDTTVWPNTCTPGGTGQSDSKEHASQKHKTMDSIQTWNAKVYPNPANTILNVEVTLQPNETCVICLYNSLGQEVRCETLINDLTTLSIDDLPSGIYYYRITDKNGNLITADKQMILH